MKFSIIIPTKNRTVLLDRALKSVLAQTNQNYELIVVDDGDGSGLNLARRHESAKIVTLSSQSAGQVAARALAISQAKGKFLAWLDDDDCWEPWHLENLDKILFREPCVAFSSGWIKHETDDGSHVSTTPFLASASAASLQENNTLLWSGIAYPKEFHQTFGDFDGSLAYYWDWDWYLRLAKAGIRFKSAQRASVWISARSSSVSSAQNELQRRIELDRLQLKHNLGSIELKNHASIADDQSASMPLDLESLRA